MTHSDLNDGNATRPECDSEARTNGPELWHCVAAEEGNRWSRGFIVLDN